MKLERRLPTLLLLLGCLSPARVAYARTLRQADQIVFDNDLPDDINIDQIAELPVRYRPFTYNLKYFPVSSPPPTFKNRSLITSSIIFQNATADSSFSYDYNSAKSPRIWDRTFPSCHGTRQSPINLRTDTCLRHSALKHLQTSQPDLDPEAVIMENNGHSIEFTFDYNEPRPVLTGGPLRSQYIFEQLHFHWGSGADQGSEHYIDSVAGELEMHVVHRNAKYSNMSVASQNIDGIVVLGILFRTDPGQRDRDFLVNLDQVREMHTSTTITNTPPGFRMRDFVGSFSQTFIAYQGSLTTPPCNEAVSWLVAKDIKGISRGDVREYIRQR